MTKHLRNYFLPFPGTKDFFLMLRAIILFALFSVPSFSQPSTFMKMYNKGNCGFAVRVVNGGSYVSAGGTDFYYNFHFMNMSPLSTTGIHFLKTDINGNLLWEKIFTKINARLIATWMEPTDDGGFIITGSGNQDVVWPPDSNDVLLIKTNSTGVIQWSKVFDTGKDELGFCVKQTFDGGFIVSCFHDAVPLSLMITTHVLLIKTDANGNIEWNKKYNLAVRDIDTHEPLPWTVKQTADSGYVMAGSTVGNHPADIAVIRTNAAGDITWARSYEHDNTNLRFSTGQDIIESSNGDLILAGSMDKDRSLMQYNYPIVLRTNSSGVIISNKIYEANPPLIFQSGFSSIEQTTDGGYFFTGMGGYAGFGDQAQLLKTDASLNMQWSRSYTWDGVATMGSRSGRETTDGGYIFAGKRQFAGSVLLKTDGTGTIPCKNPGVLTEYIPSVISIVRFPLITTGVNSFNIAFNVQSPLADTASPCPVHIATLPVELNYFSASRMEKQVIVEWTTASETNNDYFIVERSNNGKVFSEAGRIKGAGNSTGILNYSFLDPDPFNDIISYYRLKQVDFDGASDFSKIVAVSKNRNGFSIINSYADHDAGVIKIHFMMDAGKQVHCIVSDAFGRTVFEKTENASRGMNTISIPAKQISKGFYFLSIDNGREFLSTKISY